MACLRLKRSSDFTENFNFHGFYALLVVSHQSIIDFMSDWTVICMLLQSNIKYILAPTLCGFTKKRYEIR